MVTLAEQAANRRARRRANGTCIECDESPKPEKHAVPEAHGPEVSRKRAVAAAQSREVCWPLEAVALGAGDYLSKGKMCDRRRCRYFAEAWIMLNTRQSLFVEILP